MNEEIKVVLENVLIGLHEACLFSVAMTFLCTTTYILAKERTIKKVALRLKNRGKKYGVSLLVLCFYISLMLFRTLFNRDAWFNPFSDIIGVWGIYNAEGELTTEAIENAMLFFPYAILLSKFLKFEKKNITNKMLFKLVLKSTFLFSVFLEITQTLSRMGTFQLADLAYNIMGGAVGCFFCWVCQNIKIIRMETGNES